MRQQILWQPWTGPGLEHLHLLQEQEGIVADGLVLGVQEHGPFRLHYTVHCDGQWRLRSVQMSILSGSPSSVQLFTDGEGT